MATSKSPGNSSEQPNDFRYYQIYASEDGTTHFGKWKMTGFDLQPYGSKPQYVRSDFGGEPTKLVFTELAVGLEQPLHSCPAVQFVVTLSGSWYVKNSHLLSLQYSSPFLDPGTWRTPISITQIFFTFSGFWYVKNSISIPHSSDKNMQIRATENGSYLAVKAVLNSYSQCTDCFASRSIDSNHQFLVWHCSTFLSGLLLKTTYIIESKKEHHHTSLWNSKSPWKFLHSSSIIVIIINHPSVFYLMWTGMWRLQMEPSLHSSLEMCCSKTIQRTPQQTSSQNIIQE